MSRLAGRNGRRKLESNMTDNNKSSGTSTSAIETRPRFANLTAFVAGGSSGINLAVARRLAREGAAVAVISRDEARITSAARLIAEEGGKVLGSAADVRDAAAVDASLERAAGELGPIDIVVSGAAGNFLASALDLSANAFRTVVDIDLNGTFNVLRGSWEYLRKPGASLVSISAPQGAQPQMFQAHACAAKAGVNMLTKVLAMEWGPAGVRVNAISPGYIEGTEGTARLIDTDEKRVRLLSSIPLRGLGTTADIEELVVHLCSPESRYITGAVIDCDGGYILGPADSDAISHRTRKLQQSSRQ
jgi:NAD(P)-dependent dehydrogenase (short-subunit alcohol dehydrogenase family)